MSALTIKEKLDMTIKRAYVEDLRGGHYSLEEAAERFEDIFQTQITGPGLWKFHALVRSIENRELDFYDSLQVLCEFAKNAYE